MFHVMKKTHPEWDEDKLKKNIEIKVSYLKNTLFITKLNIFCLQTRFFMLKDYIILKILLLLQHKI